MALAIILDFCLLVRAGIRSNVVPSSPCTVFSDRFWSPIARATLFSIFVQANPR